MAPPANPDPPAKTRQYTNPPNADPSMPGAVDALLSSNQWSAAPVPPTGEIKSVDVSAAFTCGSSAMPNGDYAAPVAPSAVDELSSESPPPDSCGAAVCFAGTSSRCTMQSDTDFCKSPCFPGCLSMQSLLTQLSLLNALVYVPERVTAVDLKQIKKSLGES